MTPQDPSIQHGIEMGLKVIHFTSTLNQFRSYNTCKGSPNWFLVLNGDETGLELHFFGKPIIFGQLCSPPVSHCMALKRATRTYVGNCLWAPTSPVVCGIRGQLPLWANAGETSTDQTNKQIVHVIMNKANHTSYLTSVILHQSSAISHQLSYIF
jgi:hypothetical protein